MRVGSDGLAHLLPARFTVDIVDFHLVFGAVPQSVGNLDISTDRAGPGEQRPIRFEAVSAGSAL
jgi:hypothetical protein